MRLPAADVGVGLYYHNLGTVSRIGVLIGTNLETWSLIRLLGV